MCVCVCVCIGAVRVFVLCVCMFVCIHRIKNIKYYDLRGMRKREIEKKGDTK